MVAKIHEALNVLPIIEKLIRQELEYPISTAYKLHKLHEEIEEIETLLFNRFELLFGKQIDFTKLDDKQKTIYQTVMNSDIDILINNISINDIINDNAKLTTNEIAELDNFLKKC